MKKIISLFSGLLLFLLAGGQEVSKNLSEGIIFESGFEEGNKLVWDDYDGNPDTENQIISDKGPFNKTGNHVMRLRVPEGQPGGSDVLKVLPGEYDSLYYRWYLKYEKGFNFNARNHGSGFFAGKRDYLGMSGNRPSGSDFIIGTLEYETKSHTPYCYFYYRGMYQDCADPNGSCWGDHFPCTSDEGQVYCTKPEDRDPPLPPVLNDSTWYCLEAKVKMGKPSQNGMGSDGEFEFRINGVSCGHWTNLWLRTTSQLKLTMLWLSLYHHDGTHSKAGILLDEVTVSTLPVECSYTTGKTESYSNNNDLKIYPNPAKNTIMVSINNSGKYLVSISDMAGKILSHGLFSKTAMFDTSGFAKGICLLTIRNETSGEIISSQKIIIQ